MRRQPLSLPCQRDVARPQAVTEGLSHGQMPFQRSARDGGIASRLTSVPKKRPWQRDCSVLKRHFRERLLIFRQSPDLRSRPLSQGGLLVAATSLPPLSKGGGTAAGRDGGIVLRLDAGLNKRRGGRVTLYLNGYFRERLPLFRQSPDLLFRPLSQGGLFNAFPAF